MTSPRMLVITLSNIGDAIMTTPVLAALHAQYPAARIDLVCDLRSSALFEPCSYIGQLFVRDKKNGLGRLCATNPCIKANLCTR